MPHTGIETSGVDALSLLGKQRPEREKKTAGAKTSVTTGRRRRKGDAGSPGEGGTGRRSVGCRLLETAVGFWVGSAAWEKKKKETGSLSL